MKTRSGADDRQERTFGPQQPPGTRWVLTRWHDADHVEVREALGTTAFLAAQSIGWVLGELAVNPEIVRCVTQELKPEPRIVRVVRVPSR